MFITKIIENEVRSKLSALSLFVRILTEKGIFDGNCKTNNGNLGENHV